MSIQLSSGTKLQMLHFLVQKVHLCFEIHYIMKILPLVELKAIPGAPPYITGLMNVAGNSIPVIDLALRLGLKRTKKYALSTPIILCDAVSQEAAVIVDEILGLCVADKNALQMKTNFNDPESLFTGVITLDTKLALVLNMNKILSIDLSTGKESSVKIPSINLSEFKYE
jgi:chemotaxis-related protein WspB